MKKGLIIFIAVLLVLFLFIGGAAAYLGFVPAFSDTFVKRVDLGVENDPQLNIDLMKEVGLQYNISEDQLPTDKDLVYEGSMPANVTLSSEQVTSQLNMTKAESTKIPYSNVQVRFNPDGTAEASFNLNIETTVKAAKDLGYSDEEIAKGKKYVGALGKDVYVYTKVSFDMSDNELSVNPVTLRIQNFNIPTGIVKMIANYGSNAIEERLNQVPNLNVDSLKQEADKVNFVGTIPSSVSLAK